MINGDVDVQRFIRDAIQSDRQNVVQWLRQQVDLEERYKWTFRPTIGRIRSREDDIPEERFTHVLFSTPSRQIEVDYSPPSRPFQLFSILLAVQATTMIDGDFEESKRPLGEEDEPEGVTVPSGAARQISSVLTRADERAGEYSFEGRDQPHLD
ncbi:hypothetical protein ON010_g13168 [Phytophthora cinnamomi]|nr:hypothetical protein ON010_g13168 [Phytophthora cinnamomi]